MQGPEVSKTRVDLEPRKSEKLRLINGYRAVVIFGRSGVGQSNAGEALAKRLGGALYDGGRQLRAATGNTPATTSYMERPRALDKDIDATQINLLTQASPEEPVVIVAKRGGYNAILFERKNPDAKVAKILLTCNRDEAARRIFNRAIEEIQVKFAEAAEKAAKKELSEDEFFEELEELRQKEETLLRNKSTEIQRIIHEAQEKEGRDREQWKTLYPETAEIDIYDPAARIRTTRKRRDGEIIKTEIPLYDFHFSTTHRSKYQSVNYLVDELIKIGAVEVVTPSKIPAVKEEVEMTPGDIYVLDKTLGKPAGDQPR